jgi:hypothetical protein
VQAPILQGAAGQAGHTAGIVDGEVETGATMREEVV